MVNVLFVCLGNICRSPSGEGVFKDYIEKQHLKETFFIDSAGTSAYHVGEPADYRMQEHAFSRGYNLSSRSRKFHREDFEKFDYIIAMDKSNYRDLIRQDKSGEYHDKVYMMTDFSSSHKGKDVPDPYYGGADGFEIVLDMLEDCCPGLLERIREDGHI